MLLRTLGEPVFQGKGDDALKMADIMSHECRTMVQPSSTADGADESRHVRLLSFRCPVQALSISGRRITRISRITRPNARVSPSATAHGGTGAGSTHDPLCTSFRDFQRREHHIAWGVLSGVSSFLCN